MGKVKVEVLGDLSDPGMEELKLRQIRHTIDVAVFLISKSDYCQQVKSNNLLKVTSYSCVIIKTKS